MRIVVGGGLAGSILVWNLLKCGERVKLLDSSLHHSASMISGGIICPIIGKHMSKPWIWDQALPKAIELYDSISTELHENKFLEAIPVVKIPETEEEIDNLQKKYQEESFKEIFSSSLDNYLTENVNTSFGNYFLHSGYVLRTKLLLKSLKEYFKEHDILIDGSWNYDKSIENQDILTDNNISQVIFCEGPNVVKNPYFNSLPFSPTKGEIITFESDNNNVFPHDSVLLSFSKWCIAEKKEKKTQFTIGSTYDRSSFELIPSENAKEELISSIKEYIPNLNNINILNHTVGIRPTTKHHRPIIGFHPYYPKYGIFNGFGSHGSLWIPYFAEIFAKNIISPSNSIPKEVNLEKYYLPKKKKKTRKEKKIIKNKSN